MGTLYLVATPIGNLEDISLRALRILREAPLIAAEDTRRTRQLLTHYDIHTRVISYHEHSTTNVQQRIIQALQSGDVALVSDAGTPILNDPGYDLVQAAITARFPVSPIPGASAPLAALIVSGLPMEQFVYLGYLPRKSKERRAYLQEAANLPYTMVFLETPHRLLFALKDIAVVLGERNIAIARELTKLFEEIFRGTIAQAQAHFEQKKLRGEFTLVVAGAPKTSDTMVWDQDSLRQAIHQGLKEGLPPSELARTLAHQSGWPRREIYRQVVAASNSDFDTDSSHSLAE